MGTRGSMDYRSAGVDIERGDRAKAGLKDLLGSTSDALTLSKLGAFGGLYAVPPEVPDPVLVSSADGVGTKLKVAFAAGEHRTVGHDLVNHCVNDILVQGAKPLFFLDYLATGVLDECVVHDVVAGVAEGCKENACALLGGETAQMPGFYAEGEYDLAGFIVGIVSRERILDGSRVRVGDGLVALPSSGLHTNGYSLARQIVFEAAGLGVTDRFPGLEGTVASTLLSVHRSYLSALWPELEEGTVSALAHITGGGIPGNLPRSLPEGLGAEIDRSSWEVPPLFRALQDLGSVDEDEMLRVFNMGVGMIVVLPGAESTSFVRRLAARGEPAWELGRVVDRSGIHFE